MRAELRGAKTVERRARSGGRMDQEVDDGSLLGRVAMGDRDAMRLLFLRHHDGLFAFLRGRCGDDALAADALQDAMLDVWRGAGRFSGSSSVRTWMFAIARNKLTDRLRRSARVTLTDEPPEQADDAPGPEASVIAAQDAGRVRDCLDALKPDFRTVLRLAFYEDLTYAQIGEIEGVPTGTVKTRVHHAKKLLMRCLGRR